ncbi:hypothetical protein [Desulfohalovibrio reitneri]|uniref:iron-sulfur cluster-binding protein n=1 Tax=Desulfohalovibrio reitneri TaxID=1307759 RepID=UPI0004A6B6DC|nr:hypothetical protein [Desulfohalovibrio reitneri]
MVDKPRAQVKVLARTDLDEPEGWQFLLTLSSPGWKEADWSPGQFLMLRPFTYRFDPLWARPFSIAWADEEGVSLLIRQAGRGTAHIAQMEPGDEADIWGPLGTSLTVERDTPTLLLAGGVGLAPFIGYTLRHPKPENLHLLLGHTLPLTAYPQAVLEGDWKTETFRQRTSEELERFVSLLEERISEFAGRGGLVLACGPHPFLRTAARLAAKYGAWMQVSLENRMACGVGACLGCAAHHKRDGLVQSCTRGPVFWADQLEWEE